MKKVTILALDDASGTTITGPLDIFHLAGVLWNHSMNIKLNPQFEVEIVTTDGKPAKCLNRVFITPHKSIDEVKETDLILISSIVDIDKALKRNGDAIDWLLKHHKNGADIGSVCTGAFFLAETGLLDYKKATTHWGYINEFRKRYPKVNLIPERMVTDEGSVLCSGASNACFDLSVYLVEKYCGHEIAVQCAKAFIHDMGRTLQTPYTAFKSQKNHSDELVINIQAHIENNFKSPFKIEEVSKDYGVGRRTLERRFKTATGDSPTAYLQRVRVEAAKRFLETNNKSFEEITWDIGYEETSFFRKVFKKHTGLTPGQYKSKFQRMVI
ncbi:MAG: helix-turn-helix domain-containing protein [Deltaproteobacteria bacterium]|nr:helix-turn-helix domain-containing protein [Deltaproteobacteria bacterium]